MSETQDTPAAPSTEGHAHHDHDAELKLYFRIFFALLVLTGVTVGISLIDMNPTLGLIAALVVAATKGTLVVMYFMHLKMETKNIYVIAGVPLVLALILLLALWPDIAVGEFWAR